MAEPSALCMQLQAWVRATQEAVTDALGSQGCVTVEATLDRLYGASTGLTRAVAALLGEGDPIRGLSTMQLLAVWISLKSAHIGLCGPAAWEVYPPMLGEAALAALLQQVCEEAAALQMNNQQFID